MVIQGTKLLHWNYFLALESDFEHLSRYIEFSKDNYKAYSLEMAHLLLASASEVDVVLKGICKKINLVKNPRNIDKYREIVKPVYPKLCSMKVLIPRYGLEITPWQRWKKKYKKNPNPHWWTAYNDVKHDRGNEFKKANLKNTISAITGLYVVLLYYYYDEAENGELIPSPSLLRPEGACDCTFSDSYMEFGINYLLL